MFKRCPSCRSLFQAKEVKREQLENPYVVQDPGYRAGSYTYERIQNFRVTYKCNNCGHEWTEVTEKTLHDHLSALKL